MIVRSKIVSSFNCLLGLGIPQTGVQGLGPGGVGPGGKAAKAGKAPVPGKCGGLKLYVHMDISMIIDPFVILFFSAGVGVPGLVPGQGLLFSFVYVL